MNTTYFIIAVVVILVVLGAILAPIFARRRRSERFHDQYGSEYDRSVQTTGSEKKAQAELTDRKKHVEALNIRLLTASERERYMGDWTAVQAKFVDHPAEATVEADRLIMEVMQLRGYPVSDFEQRAADISVQYPELVANYRAAREIAVKNEQHHASTEDLRQAMINYRFLFNELLMTETVPPEKKAA